MRGLPDLPRRPVTGPTAPGSAANPDLVGQHGLHGQNLPGDASGPAGRPETGGPGESRHSGARDARGFLGWRADPGSPSRRLAPPRSDRSDPSPDVADRYSRLLDRDALETLWLRPDRAERSPTLTREAIVTTAVALADAEGIDAVSIRRVASVLGARPMSLYSHFGRKQDLIVLMVNEAIGECLAPGELPADWRDALRVIAYQTRAGARRHPWMLSVVAAEASLGPNALRHLEQSLSALAGLDVDRNRKLAILVAVDTYTIGQVVRELSSPSAAQRLDGNAAGGAWHTMARDYLSRLIERGGYPHLSEFGLDTFLAAFETHTDAVERRFDDGLTWLLDGIAASLPAGSAGSADQPSSHDS